MATLVLSVAGSLIGGPVGSTIGAIIGQQIDQRILFKPKGSEGPKLQDLSVQTSQYGSQFPRIYGAMRVAGTVIWATDLRESSVREGGGKGRPSSTRYVYSASFAVALSSRPIQNIGRIWADGNVIRGTNGDFSVNTSMRLYQGFGNQLIDPLIGAAEGGNLSPAFRNLAYVVFEDMPLEEFGNRIPSLTFEVFGDNEPVLVDSILGDVLDAQAEVSGNAFVNGIALSGRDVRDAVATIATGFPLGINADQKSLSWSLVEESGNNDPTAIQLSDVIFDSGSAETRLQTTRQAAARIDQGLNLRYYEPERDYQAGLRRATRNPLGQQLAIDFPASFDVNNAQDRADVLLALAVQRRDTIILQTMVVDRHYRPGRLVTISERPGVWIVKKWSWVGEKVELQLSSFGLPGQRALSNIAPGRAVTSFDFVARQSVFEIFDLPSIYDVPSTSPRVALALSSESAGWRGAQILTADANGNPAEPVQFVRQHAIMGYCETILASASPLLIDRQSSLIVHLTRSNDVLLNANIEDLLAGANLVMVGGELVQFAQAEYLGAGRYKLSILLRGRGGTEDAILGHSVDEPFVLVDNDSIFYAGDIGSFGQALSLFAIGVGDLDPVLANVAKTGRALLPLSPVKLTTCIQSDGSFAIDWIRRSRAGFAWRDSVDAALAEDFERYQIRVESNGESLLAAEVTSPSMTLSPSFVANAQMAGHEVLAVRIVQLGQYGASPASTISINI